MDNTVSPLQQEIKALTENNEALLKSKSKLQQEVLLLKRQLIAQDKTLKLIDDQGASLSTQDRLLAEKEKEIAVLLLQNEQLNFQVQNLQKEKEDLSGENTRLRKLKWYEVLMGKK